MFNQDYEKAVTLLALGGVILSAVLVFASSAYF